MIELRDKETGKSLGRITEDQLQFMIDQLEEESPEDTDYYINTTMLDGLETAGADEALVRLLRNALGSREDMEVEWTKPG